MHYPFPIGVSTVGRTVAPATGKDFYLATTTGTTSTDRVEALELNAIAGIATAKADGIANPTVGLLNLDGMRQAEIVLKTLQDNGYPIIFATSGRADGGAGYGPGVGEKMAGIVMIISRASGAPVIAGAIEFAASLVKGNLASVYAQELELARKAGLDKLLAERREAAAAKSGEPEVVAPPSEVVTEQIEGIDVLDLEDAVKLLWSHSIYAESGMGCTGPIVRISTANLEKAREILRNGGFVSE